MSVQLRDGLHFCVCVGRVVILDLAADRYFQLSEEAGLALQRLSRSEERTEKGPADRALLLGLGLLAEAPRGEGTAHACDTVRPSIELVAGGARHGRLDLLFALFQQCRARLDLRARRLSSVIASLEQTEGMAGEPSDLEEERLTRLAIAFAASSRIFSESDRCLSRSIAFKRLCNAIQVRATFVMGVNLDPFAAHCWVQQGERVVNDRLERVRAFTPIYAV